MNAIITMGLPAAGKSTYLSRHVLPTGYQLVDPDVIKESHPAYTPEKAHELHEWSRIESDQLEYELTNQGVDIAIATCGANVPRMIETITRLHSRGYNVTLLYVACSLETSIKRNQQRPRVVPVEVIMDKYAKVGKAFETIKRYADSVVIVHNG